MDTPETFKDSPVLRFTTQEDWHDWLHTHHDQPEGVWLKHAKKNSGATTVAYDEALEEALCYGWIDAQKQSYDETYWLQKFTPRKANSIWSKVNVAKVEILTASGKMQPSGRAAVENAKQNGAWEAAYDAASTSTIPADFQAALDKNPQAKQFFQTLNRTNTYAFCWRIQTAKKPETRKARIEKFVDMLSRNEKLH